MFGMVLALVGSVSSVNVQDTTRLEGVSLEVVFKKPVLVRDEKPLTDREGKIILLDSAKCKRNVKPNPDWLVVDSRF